MLPTVPFVFELTDHIFYLLQVRAPERAPNLYELRSRLLVGRQTTSDLVVVHVRSAN